MREGRSLAGGNPDHVRVWRRCKGFGAAHADAPCSATNAARHSAAAGIRPTKAPQCLWRAPQPMSARPARTPDCRAASLHTYTRAEMHTCARFIGITHRFPFGLSWPACARRATELRRGECMSCGLVRPDRSVRSAPSARSVGTLLGRRAATFRGHLAARRQLLRPTASRPRWARSSTHGRCSGRAQQSPALESDCSPLTRTAHSAHSSKSAL